MNRDQHKPSAYTLKEKEVDKLIYAAKNFRDRVIIEALYYGGMRRAESVDLDVRDIDKEKKLIRIRHGKGDKTRLVPILRNQFLSDLKMLVGERREGYIFLSTHNDKLNVRSINKILRITGERAGIKHPNQRKKYINPHLLRHSISRYLKSKGYSIEFIQNFLGHASYKTTMDQYGTMSVDDMQKEVEEQEG